jgi:hypothetical protein
VKLPLTSGTDRRHNDDHKEVKMKTTLTNCAPNRIVASLAGITFFALLLGMPALSQNQGGMSSGSLSKAATPLPPGISPLVPGLVYTYPFGDWGIAGTNHNATVLRGAVNLSGSFNLECWIGGDGQHGGHLDAGAIETFLPQPPNAIAAMSCPATSDTLTVDCLSATCTVFFVP